MNTMMIRLALLAATLASIAPQALAQSKLMRYADIHEDKIVFTFEGDLWLVPTQGGHAQRITRDGGNERWAKFSPDGSSIAFSAQYDGNTDVYLIPSSGGVAKRLTYHSAGDRVVGWWPDGQSVLFRTRREYPSRGEQVMRVSIEGGMPVKLPVDRAGLCAVSPDGQNIAYNRISREERTWKRHQGGTAQDIWMGSIDKLDYRRITDWPGSDNFPMWVGDNIYFNSDREFGTLNIYKYDVSTAAVTALTTYKDYDVKYPSAGLGQIVYQYAEELHVLDLSSGKTRRVPVQLNSDLVRMRPEFVDVSPRIGSFGLSPSGSRMLLTARGDILNIPVEDGETINLTSSTDTREKNATWSPDGQWIAYYSDKTGEEQLYLVDQKAQTPARQLTTGGQGFRRQPVWSPDSQWLIYSDKYLKLNLVNVKSGATTIIDQGEYDDGWYRWGIQDYSWSPDSKWIAYTKLEQSITEAIFLYSMDDGKSHRVTDEFHADWSPSFDPNGKYLYFLSNRDFSPIMGALDQNHIYLDMCTPMVVLLQADAASPFAPKDSEEKASDDKNDSDDKDAKKEDKDSDDASAITKIDLQGINRRILRAKNISPGNYFRLEATKKGFLYLAKAKQEFIKYQAADDSTTGKLNLYHYNIEDAETTKTLSKIANYHLSADGKKLVYRSGSSYGVVDAGKKADVGDGKVKLNGAYVEVDRTKEFIQIFNEAWRVQRDFFYDPAMHGLDWAATGEKYRRLISHCGNRSDLNYLIGEMIGEINAGHTYVFGGDTKRDAKRVSVGLLGIDFESPAQGKYHRIKHIIAGTPWDAAERSPLSQPGCPVKDGDYLIAIDSQEISADDNPFAFLQNKAGKVITLTYNDTPNSKGAKTYRLRTLRREGTIRYREWVEGNRAFVDTETGGTVGYIHIPNMGAGGLIEFAKIFYPQYYKKGFVLDVRYNGGGFTSRMILDRLDRSISGMTQPREGKPTPDPERVFHGHYVVLLNEDTGSDGENFSESVKSKKMAPLIGKRTWGGSVGIELHQPLVDGGGTTPPQFGAYSLSRTWQIEGHGVEPDIEVDNMPGDVLRGQDSQLETGIANILKRIKEDPRDLPERPAFPDKSK